MLVIGALMTGPCCAWLVFLSIQVKRCFEELLFLGSRDRVGATVLDSGPTVAPPPVPVVPSSGPGPDPLSVPLDTGQPSVSRAVG